LSRPRNAKTSAAVFAALGDHLGDGRGRPSQHDRRRTGVIEGVGEISVEGLVAKMLEHDAEHLSDLAQLRRDLLG